MHAGKAEVASFDALQAFWPALQVLAGDVSAAALTHEAFHSLWERYTVLPERYDVSRSAVHSTMAYYPLRPELAESCYALSQATGASRYLEMGAEMVQSLNAVARTPVGFAAIKSVINMQQEDHTPSFFLAETLKYLYLLFDEESFANTHASSFVFSTEGHIIPLVGHLAHRNENDTSTAHGMPIEAMPVARLRQIIASSGLSHADVYELPLLHARAHEATALLLSRRHAAHTARSASAPREPEGDDLVCLEGGTSTSRTQQKQQQQQQQQQQ